MGWAVSAVTHALILTALPPAARSTAAPASAVEIDLAEPRSPVAEVASLARRKEASQPPYGPTGRQPVRPRPRRPKSPPPPQPRERPRPNAIVSAPVPDAELPVPTGASAGSIAAGPAGAQEGGGGGRGRGGRPGEELWARVVGGASVDRQRLGQGAPVAALGPAPSYVSSREATALRTYDHFPRLPAVLWRGETPFFLLVELCVSDAGQVSDAALRGPAPTPVDDVVLAAVRTWRYRPRVVDGAPVPFCHLVKIRYDRW